MWKKIKLRNPNNHPKTKRGGTAAKQQQQLLLTHKKVAQKGQLRLFTVNTVGGTQFYVAHCNAIHSNKVLYSTVDTQGSNLQSTTL